MPTTQPSTRRTSPVDYALGESTLGLVLVARTSKGVCAIFIGEDASEVEEPLRGRFPQARRRDLSANDASELSHTLTAVIDYIEHPRRDLNLEFDLYGTEFQQSIWQKLREIPFGQTSTYTEIARAIGRPSAARAVAGACAANLVSVAIPCHRVLRSDGALSGYRWGVGRKRTLLEREGVLQEQSLI